MIKLLWKSDYELNYEKVEWSGTDTQASRQVLFTIGLVLFVFIMIINLVLTGILKEKEEK